MFLTRSAVERSLKRCVHDPSLITEAMIEAHFKPTQTEGAAEALLAMARGVALPVRPLPGLEQLRVPCLLFWGRHDRILPIAMLERFSALPDHRAVVFEDVGHMPHEEKPDAFHRHVLTFLETLP